MELMDKARKPVAMQEAAAPDATRTRGRGAPAGGPMPPPPVTDTAPKAKRDLPDPEVVTKETTDAAGKTTKAKDPYAYQAAAAGSMLYGPNGVVPGDVRQGAIGDCFLAAALASVASTQPDAITKAIKDNGDGTYTITFYEVDWSGKAKPHQVSVDGDLPYNGAAPAYAKSTEEIDGKTNLELWPSILEKAWAQFKGSYNEIGHGGNAGDVMEALTGKRSRSDQTAGKGENDPLWTKMKKAADEKKAMTAGTGDKDDAKYKDPKAGVYGWHAYTVMGVEERKEGDKATRFVKLRNPWSVRRRASDAAAVGDTKNAGEFELTWAEFRRLYDDVQING